MKKSLILLLVLLSVCTVGVCSVFVLINQEKDQVTFEESILYGDVSTVEDIKVQYNTHYAEHLFWKTTYEVGKNPVANTKFEFHALVKEQERSQEFAGVSLEKYIDCSFSAEEEEYEGINLAYKELFDKTNPGEETTEIIYLSDYIEYYTISGSLCFSDMCIYWDDFMVDDSISYKVIDYFKIPVLEDETLEISIAKDDNGNVVSTGSGSTDSDSFFLRTESVVVDNACYFSFRTQTDNDKIIDISQMPDGYGIYCLTYEKEEDAVTDIKLSMIYEMDPSVRLVNIYTHQDDSKLLVLTVEDGIHVLTVIDRDTHEMIQRLEIGETDGEYLTYVYDGFLVQLLSKNQIALIEVSEEGYYEQKFTVNYTEAEDPLYYMNHDTVFDWNGEQLAVCGSVEQRDRYRYDYNSNFYLAAYDSSGMLYYGEYENSLATGESYTDDKYYCRPVDEEPLKVTWS